MNEIKLIFQAALRKAGFPLATVEVEVLGQYNNQVDVKTRAHSTTAPEHRSIARYNFIYIAGEHMVKCIPKYGRECNILSKKDRERVRSCIESISL